MVNAVLPLMKLGGRILNVTTAITNHMLSGMRSYSATKDEINVMSKYLHQELLDSDVLVTCLHSGIVDTGIQGGFYFEQAKDLSFSHNGESAQGAKPLLVSSYLSNLYYVVDARGWSRYLSA